LRNGLTLASLAFACLVLTGCTDYNNRPPASAAETKAADDKRQAYVDTIPNLTPEQKANMKAHMGGGGPAPASGPTRTTGG
jgi:outer membrane biogenesis lipoprotein LolB